MKPRLIEKYRMHTTSILIANPNDVPAIAEDLQAELHWNGFTVCDLNQVQLCTLLSLLKSDSPDAEFEHYSSILQAAPIPHPANETQVFIIPANLVQELAVLADLDQSEFISLSIAWVMTDEMNDWTVPEVGELLHDLGYLAQATLAKNQSIVLRVCQSED
ncbi:hypothetical protein KIH39_12525 [Telmatocola sphagniphila]|uniref:Uncharacterized protein n=1 Tax=Telmatocola sphagniphila TaxID=1123043 RepID=A0A8E6BAY6_9BACT|nr:hypothetical protein [Telmatocola sphagniphila]QVL34694.1 hypothetical protein KIH39_12525 [Telmatocola sphagniphila]